MPHDDWVRLWSLAMGLPLYLTGALAVTRYFWWHMLDADDRRSFPHDGGEMLGITFVFAFWPIMIAILGVMWVITHEPRQRLSESDQRKGLLDIVNERRDAR